jgi:hypothetical protein
MMRISKYCERLGLFSTSLDILVAKKKTAGVQVGTGKISNTNTESQRAVSLLGNG